MVNDPIVSGIVDMRRMLLKYKLRRLGKLPIVEGKVPSVLEDRDQVMLMTLA